MTDEIVKSMLPAYVNGTLTQADATIIEDAAKKDPALAAEIISYREIMSAAQTTPITYQARELGWARLSKAMAAETDMRVAAPPTPHRQSHNFWKIAAAVFGIVALAQTIILLNISGASDEEATYLTVSETTQLPILKITFQPLSAEKDIRILLNEVGADIVAGPNSFGLYEIQFTDEAQRDKAVKTLKESHDIIESVTQG